MGTFEISHNELPDENRCGDIGLPIEKCIPEKATFVCSHRWLPSSIYGRFPITGYVRPISTTLIPHNLVPQTPNPQT